MKCISSGHWSHDQQIEDAVDYLRNAATVLIDATPESFDREFPEWGDLVWSGSWVDAEASGVDPEYMSWVCDWIEAHSLIEWVEGEPIIWEWVAMTPEQEQAWHNGYFAPEIVRETDHGVEYAE